MKSNAVFALALFCAVALAAAQTETGEQVYVEESYESPRVRREADPQGSIVLHGKKPLSGPDRRPTLSADYEHRFYDKNGVNANAYGGIIKQPGQHATSRAGLSLEKNYKNGFIRGYSDVQRGSGGRYSPNVGIDGGFRFRRDVDNVEEEQEEEEESPRVRREADPQGSIVIQGQKPLGGPDRRPTLSADYQHRFYDKNGMNANAYGGITKQPGLPVMPHAGLSLEKNYRNGFIRGYSDVQRGPGGRYSPNVGIGGGFRFRRDVDNVEEEQEEEEVSPRVRREADPQGSIVLQGQKPLGGPDRRPTLSADYQHRFYDKNGMNANAYGGITKQPGLPVMPRAGLSLEKNYKNGFIRGYSDVQRGPGGRYSPNVGIGGGFRFRRDVDNVEEEQGEEQVVEEQEQEY
ncbi:PREDICTED: uncharacterized protein LOC108553568 [Eufriesea mexicana]|uniref:uncharacterized protein LOC108553568 n=1 Tax=Eufriesea mexicana TaxID=516756 RepID=UPI00083BC55F|nr:PREDICTED: uncharacterized protein LOC108553568 [Eufriesea mexicana]